MPSLTFKGLNWQSQELPFTQLGKMRNNNHNVIYKHILLGIYFLKLNPQINLVASKNQIVYDSVTFLLSQ